MFGALLGIAGIVLALVSTKERRPDMRFTTISESNVLDVHAALPELDVMYKGRSIQRAGLNLKIITLRVENAGDLDVLQAQYDQDRPWGFWVGPGEIVALSTVSSNSQYLRSALAPRRDSSSRVNFNKVIFDRGGFVTLQVLVLHPKGNEPRVVPFGKIAGMNQFTSGSAARPSGRGRSTHPFGGGMSQQLRRLVVYGFAFLFVTAFFGIATFGIIDGWQRHLRDRRRQRVTSLLQTVPVEEAGAKVVRTTYVGAGLRGLERLRNVLIDPIALDKELDFHREFVAKVREAMESDDEDAVERYLVERALIRPSDRGILALIDAGLVARKEEGARVSVEFLHALNSLVAVLQ
jgi:hypothetical protein